MKPLCLGLTYIKTVDVAQLLTRARSLKGIANMMSYKLLPTGYKHKVGLPRLQQATAPNRCPSFLPPPAGHRVSVVNPEVIKEFAQMRCHASKTDKTDASFIPSYGLKHQRHLVHPLPEIRHLQALVRRLDALVDMSKREEPARALKSRAVKRASHRTSISDQQIAQTQH